MSRKTGGRDSAIDTGRGELQRRSAVDIVPWTDINSLILTAPQRHI